MDSTTIRQIRKQFDLSQERFAQLLGVSMQSVRRWENGLAKPLPILSLRLEQLERQASTQVRRGGGVMADKVKDRGRGIGVDFGLGLGGLFKGMGSLMDVLAKMDEEGGQETGRSGTVEAMGGKAKGVYGFSVRLGLGGKPVVERFGNIQETASGAVVAEAREPLVDVLDEEDHILVLAELPGIDEKDIRTRVDGDILEISASTGDRQYEKEILLSSAVDAENVETRYGNGVLEVRLTKVQSD